MQADWDVNNEQAETGTAAERTIERGGPRNDEIGESRRGHGDDTQGKANVVQRDAQQADKHKPKHMAQETRLQSNHADDSKNIR